MIDKFLLEEHIVVYGVEKGDPNVPKSQLVNEIYYKIKQSGLIDEIEYYIENKMLIIIDIREIYSFKQSIDINDPLNKWISIIKEAKRKGNFRGIAIIAEGTTAFRDSNNQIRLLLYEQAILKAATEMGVLRVICCYLEESIDRLHFSNLISIINSHQCIIRGRSIEETRQISSSILRQLQRELKMH